jgi:hypothetical protein
VPIALAGEKRPQNGRGNWREHRLVTVLLDGSELGFAPVVFSQSAITQALPFNQQRIDRRRMAASQDLDGDAGLDCTVTSITIGPARRSRSDSGRRDLAPMNRS